MRKRPEPSASFLGKNAFRRGIRPLTLANGKRILRVPARRKPRCESLNFQDLHSRVLIENTMQEMLDWSVSMGSRQSNQLAEMVMHLVTGAKPRRENSRVLQGRNQRP